MTARTVILGGGFGGIATATALRNRLGPEHEIVLIDRRETFFMGLRKLWIMIGAETPESGRRRLDALEQKDIKVVRAEITAIDAPARRVETDAGSHDGDYMVIALGAESRPDLIPGLTEHGHDLYNASSTEKLAEAVARFPEGRILLSIAGLPYKCPPAPYEAVMLLEDTFRTRGLKDRVSLTFTTMQPQLLPNAGPPGHARMAEELERKGIAWHVKKNVKQVEQGRLMFDDGTLEFDLLIGVPPHRVPKVVTESGLGGEGGWITVDPGTLATAHPGVFAIGDVVHIPLANKMPLPKAGLFAEAHGARVAAAIFAEIRGDAPPPPFDGRGYCFVELGGGQATLVEGDFFATPVPRVELKDSSAEFLEGKRRFESERLERWFGS